MGKNLYDRKFFEKSCRPDRLHSYKIIAEYLCETFQPESVIDYGCGSGWVLMFLKNLGVTQVGGVEPNTTALTLQPDLDIKGNIYWDDLTKPFVISKKFDLAICIEVAEHIEEIHADTFIFNITRNSDLLIFSAAPPGQGGVGHVNEQPWGYWFEKFLTVGFSEHISETKHLQEYLKKNKVKSWYSNNMRVLGRNK